MRAIAFFHRFQTLRDGIAAPRDLGGGAVDAVGARLQRAARTGQTIGECRQRIAKRGGGRAHRNGIRFDRALQFCAVEYEGAVFLERHAKLRQRADGASALAEKHSQRRAQAAQHAHGRGVALQDCLQSGRSLDGFIGLVVRIDKALESGSEVGAVACHADPDIARKT